MSRRFDSLEYLTAWKETGRFPAIHDELFELIAAEATGTSFLDLCCSTGLMAQRIATRLKGATACGVDGDVDAVLAGAQAGVSVPILTLKVELKTMDALLQWVRSNRVTVLVARRCFPELFGHDHDLARAFSKGIHSMGVREVFLQGRVPVLGARNTLASVLDEVKLLEADYRVSFARGQCAYLTAR